MTTTTPDAPAIGKPRILAPMNGPESLDGMSKATIAFDDGTAFTVAGWTVSTSAPDADGVMRAQLTGWMTDYPEGTYEKMQPDYEDDPRPLHVVSGPLAGHEPLDGKAVRRSAWSVGVPYDGATRKPLWDHPGEWLTLRWIHAVIAPSEDAPAAAPGLTFADLIRRHSGVVAMILSDGDTNDLASYGDKEVTVDVFIDHVDSCRYRLAMSPTWGSQETAAVAAHGYLCDALPLADDDPAKGAFLQRANECLNELGDEDDWLC